MNLEPFVKLSDPGRYIACSWDLATDHEGREHWVSFFIEHIRTLLSLGVDASIARGEPAAQARERADACVRAFDREFESIRQRYRDPSPDNPPLTILLLDVYRDRILRAHGFVDCMIDLKDRENRKALPLLRDVVQQIDQMHEREQIRALVEGVFAGNKFDMGAKETAQQYLHGGESFAKTRSSLKARPWLIDDFEKLERTLLQGPRHVVFFIDNAGSDFILGAMPLIYWLARRGTRVVIAANERPTLNDMTASDVRAWWPGLCEQLPHLSGLSIEIVSTGTGEPLIDLSKVSPELNAASRDADMVILEGMGRGVESNLDAHFSCDALNIAMIKDRVIAARVGGVVFDCVCRFR